MLNQKTALTIAFLWFLLGAIGCSRKSTYDSSRGAAMMLPALAALGAEPGHAVVAQGQLEPATGIIPIMAPPGDRVEAINVKEGQSVKAGQVLGRLASQAAKDLELQILIARRDEAVAKVKADEATAVAKLEVSKVGLRQAQATIDQAVLNLKEAESGGGKLALLEQQVEIAEAKLRQLRTAASERDGGRLVTESTIEQQQLAVDQAKADLNLARRDANEKIADGALTIEAAEKELKASELAIASAKASAGLQTMDKQIELLRLQLDSIKLISPVEATILSIDTGPGEPTSTVPVIRLADTSQMVVRVEVNVAELPRLQVGAKAAVTSSAIEGALTGKVTSISQLVGSPRLPSPNPMARVDWRSVQVLIDIDPDSVARAAERVQLQVDVAIEAKP